MSRSYATSARYGGLGARRLSQDSLVTVGKVQVQPRFARQAGHPHSKPCPFILNAAVHLAAAAVLGVERLEGKN